MLLSVVLSCLDDDHFAETRALACQALQHILLQCNEGLLALNEKVSWAAVHVAAMNWLALQQDKQDG